MLISLQLLFISWTIVVIVDLESTFISSYQISATIFLLYNQNALCAANTKAFIILLTHIFRRTIIIRLVKNPTQGRQYSVHTVYTQWAIHFRAATKCFVRENPSYNFCLTRIRTQYLKPRYPLDLRGNYRQRVQKLNLRTHNRGHTGLHFSPINPSANKFSRLFYL